MKLRQESICSSTAAFLTIIPRRAASEIPPNMATGIASNNGQGVAITETARNRSGLPLSSQPRVARPRANGVYHAPSLSPMRRIRGWFCSVCRMTLRMRAYLESSGTFRARIFKSVSPLIAPESTLVPGALDSSKGSPVRKDSSILPWPSVTSPSTGQISCGNSKERISYTDRISGDVCEAAALHKVRLRWHSLCQGFENGRCLSGSVALQRLSSGEHKNDHCCYQVLMHERCADDGDAGNQIGAEFPVNELAQQIEQQRSTGKHSGEQWQGSGSRIAMQSKPEKKVEHNSRKDKYCNVSIARPRQS